MVLAVGSMAVKGVFSAGNLLTGLAKTATKFKGAGMEAKSTSTEMKRMKGTAHGLSKALALVGVGGFTALIMSAPQLAGALTKIKTEMQLLAWSVGKHLKPALDSVATVLHGIRTGDWTTIKQGVIDLGNSIVDLATKAGTFIIDVIFGEGTTEKLVDDVTNWVIKMKKAWNEGDLVGLINTSLDPVRWLTDRSYELGEIVGKWAYNTGYKFGEELKRGETESINKMLDLVIPGYEGTRKLAGFAGRVSNRYGPMNMPTRQMPTRQIGGIIPTTGVYQMHAGETVTMTGSSGTSNVNEPVKMTTPRISNVNEPVKMATPRISEVSKESNITVDFSGANINLSGGLQLDQFADVISMRIAEKQQSVTY